MNIIDELKWRGAVNQQTDEEGLYKLVGEKSISLYCGIDPTGDSMHIGHLIPFMILKRFQLAGHHPVIVIGGGITAARKYIMPSLLKELRGKMHTITGEELNRVQMKVYDLDNEEEFKEFAKGDQRALKVYGTDRYVAYDPQKRIGVMISKLGASNAISVGAYAFALSQLDAQKQQ